MNFLLASELEKQMDEGGCEALSPDGRYYCNFPCPEGVHISVSSIGYEIAEWTEKDMVDPPIYYFFQDNDWNKISQPSEDLFPKQDGSMKAPAKKSFEEIFKTVLKAEGKQPFAYRRKSRDKSLCGRSWKHGNNVIIAFIAKRYGIKLCGGCNKIEPCKICYSCSGCHQKRNPSKYGVKCSCCEKCSNCCQCFECGRCGNRRPNTSRHLNSTQSGRARGCGYCDRCCECGITVPYTTVVNSFTGEPTTRYPRFMGVEIECGIKVVKKGDKLTYAELQDKATAFGAGIGSDGSVRVEGLNPVEIVSAPARGTWFIAQVTELCDTLALYNAAVNKSCGLHVHVDMRRVSQGKILSAIRLYSRIEKALFSIVSFSRRGESKATLIKYQNQGGYAGPWADKLKLAGVLNDEVSIESRMKALDLMTYQNEATANSYKTSHMKHGSRYHGLNIQSLHVHNTLEFRLHQGTVNANKILMWAGVCSAIVEYALLKGEDHVKAMKGSSAQILEKVLGTDQELITWCRARRAYFIEKERKRRGLAPWNLGRHAPSPGPVEESESSGPDRVRRSFAREQGRIARGVATARSLNPFDDGGSFAEQLIYPTPRRR